MPVVFIPQVPHFKDPATGVFLPKVDISPAKKYGDLRVIITGAPRNELKLIAELKDQLIEFTEKDFLMCIGNPVFIGAAAALVAARLNGIIPMLKYNKYLGEYGLIRVDMNG